MKKNLSVSVRLTFIMIILLAVLYPLLIAAVGRLTPGKGKGETISVDGKVVGYERIGQRFTDDKYFNGRPSAVDYNAAGSAGSNKGPSNPDYLRLVQDRIDSFLVHNPGIRREQIPSDLVTASGSGLDPHISPDAARVQINRIAAIRKIPVQRVSELVEAHVEQPALGPSYVHVLQLNIALDALKN
ncbi:MAG: K(+)-transporting ATPase subunit C [Chitinophagaceae bacterium]